MHKALFVMDPQYFDLIYGPEQKKAIGELVDVQFPLQSEDALKKDNRVLRDIEVIMSGWFMPPVDEAFLAAAPKLRALFYGAGTIRRFATDAMWNRGVLVTSAYAANAVPVAEYCLATTIFSLKLGWRHADRMRAGAPWDRDKGIPGCYKSRVGLISLGMIARKFLDLLKPIEVDVSVYSTSLTPDKAKSMGVKLCSLDEIFQTCDVVSLHTPDLPETRDMIRGRHFEMMKPNATFINSARGAVVNEKEMTQVLAKRPDLTAVLDVLNPEPPEPGNPLLKMKNVVVTPHIAGSMFLECRRMGSYVVEEVRRFVNGQPPAWPVTRETAARLA
jgi:phosphoglycerate dehydrogenase-like enzyme